MQVWWQLLKWDRFENPLLLICSAYTAGLPIFPAPTDLQLSLLEFEVTDVEVEDTDPGGLHFSHGLYPDDIASLGLENKIRFSGRIFSAQTHEV